MYIVGRGLIGQNDFLHRLHTIVKASDIIKDNKKICYYNLPAAFDIETTSFYDGSEKRAIMYHWQFGIGNIVTTGRTWEEYVTFIENVKTVMDLSANLRLVVYVHNLPYEFQFMRKYFIWDEVFLLDNRKPVYAQNGGILYKCSLKLSGGRSLEKVGLDLQKYKVNKASGDLNYSLMRHSLTPMTEKELYYCEMDIRVLLSYIQEKIEVDGDITRIPLTNTGYVREHTRKECFKRWKPYKDLMSNLTIEPDEYSQLKRAFQGGFTHANAHWVRKKLSNISSQDFASSYPARMVLNKFPMSKARLIDGPLKEDELKRLFLTKCCLFDIEIWGLIPILHNEHPLSSYKCYIKEGVTLDNGRVVTASHVKTTITEQDYFVYIEFYTWDKCSISNFRYYEKGYLPKPIILSVLKMYQDKTSLKGIPEKVVDYMISKNMINANFGMMVTDIIRKSFEYLPGSTQDGKETDYPKKRVDKVEKIEEYNVKKNRFLFYPWGVWITAYARACLFSAIIELGEDYCYSDTDSVKYMNSSKHVDYFNRYNKEILDSIRMSSEKNHIPIEMYMPKNKKGVEKVIGVWEDEGEFRKFKTLGAKRYITMRLDKDRNSNEDFFTFTENGIEITIQNNFFILTLAGAHKKKAMDFLIKTGDPFGFFDDNLIIPPDSSGRLIATYIDYETSGIIVDYNGIPYNYHELSSTHMEASEYRLGMGEYAEYLKEFEGMEEFIQYCEGKKDISE